MLKLGSLKGLRQSDITVAAAVVAIVLMMIVPLPHWLLDMLLVFNVAISLVVMLVAIFNAEPLQFSSFPTLLLMTTLFRLALNVSTTRQLLLTGEAGAVIRQFGNYVVGGNPAVGLIVFLILIIIQFIVITKGSERVSEVGARFTLDAMPGKQMAIDADLNAGMINEAQARERRQVIEREADFHGAMDGASKFVKGDAIAGLIIVAVNLVGGLVVGMIQQNMGFAQAWSHYSLRTIGDGLISQIPALLTSTAAGIIVTRAAGEAGLGAELGAQLLGNSSVLFLAGVVLAGMSLIPGLPLLPFMAIGCAFIGIGYVQANKKGKPDDVVEELPVPITNEVAPETSVQLAMIDPLEIELGYALVPLADSAKGGDLLDRVVAVRRQVAANLGLLLPYIRVRDNLGLLPNEYVIKLRGNEVGRFELQTERLLAMDPGGLDESVSGNPTVEPAFGLPALWIASHDKQRAELMGYTVVDSMAVIVAHLTEVIKEHAHELLGRQEVRTQVDAVKESHPALVDELVPGILSLGEIQKVLQNLLREGVPIRDLVLIFEVLADWGGAIKDADTLTEKVRVALGRTIVANLGASKSIKAITLSPEVEQLLVGAMERKNGGPPLEPSMTQHLLDGIVQEATTMAARGEAPVLVTVPSLRSVMRRLAEHSYPRLAVLSYAELDPKLEIEATGVIGS